MPLYLDNFHTVDFYRQHGFNLHQYQVTCINYIKSRKRCGLFLDMGCGKTLVTLIALAEIQPKGNVLVIAPKSVAKRSWFDEIDKWKIPVAYDTLMASTKAKRYDKYEEVLNTPAKLYTINTDLIKDLVEYYKNKGVEFPFNTVVVDECHAFKSGQSQRFKALKEVINKPEYVIMLTGTPAPAGYLDLWSQIYLLDNGKRLGKYFSRYREEYFYPNKRINNIPCDWRMKPNADDYINKQISDIVVSVKNDVLRNQLPDLLVETVKIPVSQALKDKYQKFKSQKYMEIGGQDITAQLAITLFTKLRQFVSGNVIDTESGQTLHIHDEKVDALERLRDQSNDNLLVAYWFKSDIAAITKRFPDAVVYDPNKPEIITEWNNGNIPMLLINPASAGLGLNLQQGGHTFIWYTLPTSLMHYEQANARLYRQGQTNMVTIYHLCLDLDIEDKLLYALQNKADVQNMLMDYIKL